VTPMAPQNPVTPVTLTWSDAPLTLGCDRRTKETA
jgi:hypothetical protein